MRRNTSSVAIVCMCLITLALLAHGGQLSPPSGAVGPTMHTLDEISAQISGIQAGSGGASVKRVIRGVIDFTTNDQELSQSFSPAIDPAKSVVVLGNMCATSFQTTSTNIVSRSNTCLISLTATQITVHVDASISVMNAKVGYQIIEYN